MVTAGPASIDPSAVFQGETVVLAAGGTGGHLFPAQALAEALKAEGAEVILVTDRRGHQFAEQFPADRVLMVEAATLVGGGVFGKARAVGSMLVGVVDAWRHLGLIKPAIVIGFGGYPSLPTMLGALLRGLPTVIHEQNALLGRVNRRIAARVNAIACGFDDPQGGAITSARQVVVTGNPVRERMAARAEDPYQAPGNEGPIRLLIFGGSQGARVMGAVVPEALAALPEPLRARLQVTQQTRAEDLNTVAARYEQAGIDATVAPFITDMDTRMSEAALVIARAGASTITELSVLGRPSILVPLPSAMDDHQTVNARVLVRAGAAWHLAEPKFTPDGLARLLADLLASPERLTEAAGRAHALGRPDATARLVSLAARLARPRMPKNVSAPRAALGTD